jgi:hypothetical protein
MRTRAQSHVGRFSVSEDRLHTIHLRACGTTGREPSFEPRTWGERTLPRGESTKYEQAPQGDAHFLEPMLSMNHTKIWSKIFEKALR